MTVIAAAMAIEGWPKARLRLLSNVPETEGTEAKAAKTSLGHKGTLLVLLRHPSSLASTASECNAVHCRPNTVSSNRFPRLPTSHMAINITHAPRCLGSRLLSLPSCSRLVLISLPAREGARESAENEINDGVMQTLSAPAAHGKLRMENGETPT